MIMMIKFVFLVVFGGLLVMVGFVMVDMIKLCIVEIMDIYINLMDYDYYKDKVFD